MGESLRTPAPAGTFSHAAPCAHFGECGGCVSQHLSYEAQLEEKKRWVETLFRNIYPRPIDLIPSPVLFHYRNKIDPAFSPEWFDSPPPPGTPRRPVLGFKTRGNWYRPVAPRDCLIGPRGLNRLFEAVREWVAREELPAFDSRRNTGLLRNLLIREARRAGQRMVMLITTPGSLNADAFTQAVLSAWPDTAVLWGTFSGRGEVATAEWIELLHGSPEIQEILHVYDRPGRNWWSEPDAALAGIEREQAGLPPPRVLRFRISPLSFFQTNTLAAERLYALLRARVMELQPPILYDLYGGMGTIALALGDLAEGVHSVEEIAPAVEDGKWNARIAEAGNIHFHQARVRAWLKERIAAGGIPPESLVIVDPPRAGLTPKVVERLVALAPRHLLYVSCNPPILARELPPFLDRYRLASLDAVDMFPHTPHVEVVATLERRTDG
ncbi:MAG TPA: hypothetical protein PK349_10015 [Candidatus Hydrogenedentes bacterium]|nr:hypothetical protein [Candidatus Hydrogenedentota bacterium]